MKRLALALCMILVSAPVSLAGEITTQSYNGDSGVTLVNSRTNTTGVSVLYTVDLARYSDLQLKGSIQYPQTVLCAATTADPGGTGTQYGSGVSVTYYIYPHNRDFAANEIEADVTTATSGVSQIADSTMDSGNTKTKVYTFTPPLSRYMTILGKSGITDIQEPGFVLVFQ